MSTEHDKSIGDLIEYHRRKAAKLRSEALFELAAMVKQKVAHLLQRGKGASEESEGPTVRPQQWA